jgi:carboxylesterase type B
MGVTPEPAPQPEAAQPELFALDTVQGYGALKPKEQLFAQAIFEGHSQRAAVKLAGFTGSAASLDVAASRLLKTAKVQGLLNQAWVRSGASIDTTLRQAAELQARAFREAINSDTVEKRKLASAQWKDASSLIASIHGKLTLNVKHTGTVEFSLPPEALAALTATRRELIAANQPEAAA